MVEELPINSTFVLLREEGSNGGCSIYKEGKWSSLYLHLERPVYRCLIRVKKSELSFQLLGQWLTWQELEEAVKKEKGSTRGCHFGV